MSLSNSLGVSLSGLQNTQRALQITSGNVANADTPGYTRKTHNQTAAIGQDVTFGVRVNQATRDLNTLVQAQWQHAQADKAYAQTMESFLSRVDTSFGQPGSAISLDTMFSEVLSSFEALATTPESLSAQLSVINRSDEFAGQLRSLSENIQNMRLEAEQAIGAAVGEVNDALGLIRNLNQAIVEYGAGGPAPDLLDQRDAAINVLAENLDVKVNVQNNGAVNITTRSGLSLFDAQEVRLSFDERSAMSAQAVWTNDPATSGAGTVNIVGVNGANTNVFDGNYLRTGKIEALRELRDEKLVEAQRQLDELAAQVALAASSVTQTGTPVSVGLQNGFDLDLTGLQPGNVVEVTIDNAGVPQQFSFVAVTDPALLPLPPETTAKANDNVVGIDISGGIPAAIGTIAAALGGAYTTSNPVGNTVRITSAGGANTLTSVNADITRIGLTDEGLGLPLFVDSGLQLPFSNALENGGQLDGFAGRITVGSAIRNDPSRLVIYDTLTNPTAAGDPIRANTILSRFTQTNFEFTPQTGVGTQTREFSGTVQGFIGQIISYQGGQAANAQRLNDAEEVRFAAIETRLASSSEVNIDDEMANLIELQNAYSANARVMSVVQELMDELLRIF